MNATSLYDAQRELSQAEIEFHEGLGYQAHVSYAVLQYIEGTFLDVGVGPSAQLGKWVEESGSSYTGLDIQHCSLKRLKARGLATIGGDVCSLPFPDRSVNITHERFMLMHLSDERRAKAITEMVRVARSRAVFIEYDWRSFVGGPLVNDFRDFMLRAFPQHVKTRLGGRLSWEIQYAFDGAFLYNLRHHKFSRPPGMYWSELVLLSRAFHGAMERLGTPFVLEAERFMKKVEAEAKKQTPEIFTPPDIVAVEAIK